MIDIKSGFIIYSFLQWSLERIHIRQRVGRFTWQLMTKSPY